MFWLIASSGPLAWLLEMGINVSFSYAACASNRRWQLIVVTILMALMGSAGAWAASRQRHNAAAGLSADQFKATVAMAVNGLLVLLIIVQGSVLLLTRGCA